MTKKKCNIFSTKSCNHLCFNCIFQSECVAESFSQLPNDSLQGLKIHVHLPHVWWPTRHHKTCLARHVHFYSLSCSHSSNDISSSLHLSSRWRRTTMSAMSCHRCPQSPGKEKKTKLMSLQIPAWLEIYLPCENRLADPNDHCSPLSASSQNSAIVTRVHQYEYKALELFCREHNNWNDIEKKKHSGSLRGCFLASYEYKPTQSQDTQHTQSYTCTRMHTRACTESRVTVPLRLGPPVLWKPCQAACPQSHPHPFS